MTTTNSTEQADRSALYASIFSTEEIYRPPSEKGSALLEVARGCSWAKCTFCDFIKDLYQISDMDQIEYRLKTLRQLQPDACRMFFLGQNAFCLSTEHLLAVMKRAKYYIPSLSAFSMYARIDDVLRKTPEELSLLWENGLRDLHIGIESGNDTILTMVNKGCTAFDIRDGLSRLDKASIGYYLTIIPGLGGKAYSDLHAIDTARLLNLTHPKQIWALALKLWPDTPLAQQADRGEFQPMKPWEILLEERILLQNLTLRNTFYMDTTVLGKYTVQGRLPDQKTAMLQAIEQLLAL